jgi:hypothetical protein
MKYLLERSVSIMKGSRMLRLVWWWRYAYDWGIPVSISITHTNSINSRVSLPFVSTRIVPLQVLSSALVVLLLLYSLIPTDYTTCAPCFVIDVCLFVQLNWDERDRSNHPNQYSCRGLYVELGYRLEVISKYSVESPCITVLICKEKSFISIYHHLRDKFSA